jgi:predicted PurR-regulated permease PerM
MSDSPRQPVNRDVWWTRDHVLVIVLFVATGILVVLCWRLVQPFVTPLAWALALAVVAHPLHGWLARRIKKPGLAAGIALFAIALVLSGLVIFVGQTLVSSIASGTQTFQSFFQGGQWREQLARIPWLGSLLAALEQQVNLGGQLQSMNAPKLISKRRGDGPAPGSGRKPVVFHWESTKSAFVAIHVTRRKAPVVTASIKSDSK